MNDTEARALSLLGDGYSAEVVAKAIGVTPARISQMLSNDEFKELVAELRFENLQLQTTRDKRLDTLEDKTLDKLEKYLPLITRPMELIKAFQTLNSAKRRGSPAEAGATLINQTVVNLTIPSAIINKYKADANGQVIEVNDMPFISAPSSLLPTLIKREQQHEEPERVTTTIPEINVKVSRAGPGVCAEDL
jgi:hypothetical protein